MRTLTCILLQNTYKKGTRKPKVILTFFNTVLTISFLLLSTNSASVEFYKLTTLEKMILLAVEVPSSNKRLVFPSILFTDNQWQEVVFEKYKKAGKSSQQRKEICLRTTVETPFLNFFKSIFIVKQVVLLFSGINVQWPKVLFSQVFEKANCNAFKNVM